MDIALVKRCGLNSASLPLVVKQKISILVFTKSPPLHDDIPHLHHRTQLSEVITIVRKRELRFPQSSFTWEINVFSLHHRRRVLANAAAVQAVHHLLYRHEVTGF